MSLKALTWAFDLDQEGMNTTMKTVLLALANYANESGITYPRQSTIAKKTLLSRQAVNVNLGRLEDMGIIKMTRRKHDAGGFRSSEYQLMMPNIERVNDDDTDGEDDVSTTTTRRVRQDDKACKPERQGVSSSTTRVVNQDDNLNQVLEPSHEPKRRKPRGPAAPFPEDAFDQFWKLYPNKDAKGAALKSFDRISQAGNVEFSAIMEGLQFYVNKDDFREWAMPTTWLNQERWEARPKQKRAGVAQSKWRKVVAI